MSPIEIKVRRMAAMLDVPALEALSNKGLLRRAQKDLERGLEVKVLGDGSGLLRLDVAGFVIELPESGAAAARCSCRATAGCQHLITALLFLQKSSGIAETSTEDASPGSSGIGALAGVAAIDAELLAFSGESLRQWAGKSAFGLGLKLALEGSVELVRERLLTIRLVHANAEVHFVPGGGLDGAIVSGASAGSAALVVASVIGFQRISGVTWIAPTDTGGAYREEGVPRGRSEVLESCQVLLLETLSIGLSRLSTSNLERWRTLGVSALGVHLPRLALMLRGVSDEVSLLLKRDARGESGRLLGRMAQAYALCYALIQGGENPRPDLVGTHRARYTDVGNLDLVGVSAWPWRTASGYCGLTVLFWDSRSRQWNSWSESRPSHQKPEFDPVKRFSQPGPWEGADSPQRLVHAAFRLHHAKRSAARRLSGSTVTRVLITSDTGGLDPGIPVYLNWEFLETHWASHRSFGLKEENPLDLIVVLKPALWSRRGFDPVLQTFEWVVCDAQRVEVPLTMPFSPWHEKAIQQLEALRPEEMLGARVLGRLQQSTQGFSIQPHSIHWDGGKTLLLGLGLPTRSSIPAAEIDVRVGTPQGRTEVEWIEEEVEDEFEPEMRDASDVEVGRVLGGLLMEVDDQLLAIAEGGAASHRGAHLIHLENLAFQCTRLGLKTLEASLKRVCQHPREPVMLLRCAYEAHLYRSASG